MAIGDLNGDGHLDLAVANYSSTAVSVLLGDGAGRFGPHTDFPTGDFPWAVAIGDLNGDGHLDLAVANKTLAEVSVLLGDGTGGFGPHADFPTASHPFSVAIGDLNGDGHPDLATTGNNTSNTVSVFRNGLAVPTAPGPPTIGTVVAGDSQATVSWTAPAFDGGSPITGYVVTPYFGRRRRNRPSPSTQPTRPRRSPS